MKVLIVDDQQAKVQEIAKVIESVSTDIEIHISMFSKDARCKLQKDRFDLLILDLALPKLASSSPSESTGLELLTEIVDGNSLHEPKKVFCLTGIDDISNDFRDIIQDKLVTLHKFEFNCNRWRNSLSAELVRQLKPQQQYLPKSFETDFLVVCALKEPELSEVLNLKFNWSNPELIDDTSYVYYGNLDGIKIIATSLPRMGAVSASIIATKLIEKFKPRFVVMTGICAGIRSETDFGDILLACSSWNWETGKWVTVDGTRNFRIEPFHINIDPSISNIFDVILNDKVILYNLHLNYSDNKPKNVPKFMTGSIACGSSVIGNKDVLDSIIAQDRKVLGVDMESFGIYYSSYLANNPKPKFFSIKSVCDFADEEKNDSYQRYAAYTSSKLLELFIQRAQS